MIVIIGASGNIGSQLYSEATRAGKNVVGTSFSRSEPHFKRFDMRTDTIEKIAPCLDEKDCVYLLSGFTNPNWIYQNPEKSQKLNVEATLSTIDQIFECRAKLIFVSTELVFNGARGGYTEADNVSPTTLYGRQKAAVEAHIQASEGRWNIVRTGATITRKMNGNCPVEKTFKTLLEGNARIARDNIFTITDIRDTCFSLLKMADYPSRGIYHVVSGPPVTRIELADWIIEKSRFGNRMAYKACRFEEIPYPEERPRISWLSNKKLQSVESRLFTRPFDAVAEKIDLIDLDYLKKEKAI